VGGGDPTHGPVGGIHWHMNVGNKVEYVATDPLKQRIPWIRFTDAKGVVTEYRAKGFQDDPAKHTLHTMDCMDCHNRPAHQFRAPNDAVDLAIALGRISTNLPAIKRAAVLALTADYRTEAEAVDKIAGVLRGKYGARPELPATIEAVQAIYRQNFFAEMKTDWRTHPNNIGHKDWPGCFRCHDNEHATADGKEKISNTGCNSCHTIVAEGKTTQLTEFNAAGAEFKHPEEGWDSMNCFDCHNGTMGEN